MTPHPDPLARGDLVHLRHPRPEDEREWLELRRASRPFLEPTEPRGDATHDLYSAGAFARQVETRSTPTNERHVIVRNADNAIVGMVNLSQISSWPFYNAILGYWVGHPFIRRGYGREGVRLCVSRAFGELGLHRVEANVMPENEPSLALVRALGFRHEGFSPNYLQIAGEWRSHTRWAITNEDWRAR